MRILRLPALLFISALLFSSCASESPPVLQTGNVTVSQAALDDIVGSLAADKETTSLFLGVPADSGDWGTLAGAGVLNIFTTEAIASQAIADNQITVSEQDRQDAQSEFATLPFGSIILPDSLRETIINLIASNRALDRAITQTIPEPTTEELQAQYDKFVTETDFSNYGCLQNIFFAPNTSPDQPSTAQRMADAQQRLATGEDFLTVAADVSDADASLGCNTLDFFITEIAQVAATLETGDVSEPFESSVGTHLLKMNVRGQPPIDVVSEYLKNEVLSSREEQLSREVLLQDAATRMTITVDPRYGVWDADSLQIVPQPTQEP